MEMNMNELDVKRVGEMAAKLKDAFLAIQQPRSDFALEHFVMQDHDTAERQYAQVVEELRRAYSFIRTLLLDRERLEIEISRLSNSGDRLTQIDAEKKGIELEDIQATLVGKLREFNCLFKLWETFPTKFTADDINKAEPEYWMKRLSRQSALDRLSAMNGVRAGNIDALRQAGIIPTPYMDFKEVLQGPQDKPQITRSE